MPRCLLCLVVQMSPSKNCRKCLWEMPVGDLPVRFLFSLLRMQELGCLIRRR